KSCRGPTTPDKARRRSSRSETASGSRSKASARRSQSTPRSTRRRPQYPPPPQGLRASRCARRGLPPAPCQVPATSPRPAQAPSTQGERRMGSSERRREFVERRLHLIFDAVGLDVFLRHDGLQQIALLRAQPRAQFGFVTAHVVDADLIEIAARARV